MRLSHKTEEELMVEKLLPIGDYPFEISKATDEVVTKEGENKGKTYIKLTLKVYEQNGNGRFIDDVIFDELKLIRILKSIDREEFLKQEKINGSQLEGGAGNLYLGIREDKTGQYLPKNVVFSYKKLPQAPKSVKNPFVDTKDNELDDEIPF